MSEENFKKKYWFVPYDSYGQHGCFVEEAYFTPEEFELHRSRGLTSHGVYAAFFDSYLAALAYAQD